MSLHLPTLLAIAVFVSITAAVLLLLSWAQDRNVQALALWAAAFLTGALGLGLIAGRGEWEDFWTITIANAMVALAYGIMWGGVRNFEGRKRSFAIMGAGAGAWLLACQNQLFYATPSARVALMSAILVLYSGLSAWEFWRGRDEHLAFRLPIILLLIVHAALSIIRIPLAGALPLPEDGGELHVGWWSFVAFEGIFFVICTSYLLGGIAKERLVLWYKRASLVDPLTGAANRRAFMDLGRRMLRRLAFHRGGVALLLFDLDRFKSINDGFGHHAGDSVLVTFCRTAQAALRPNDLFGRLGGEEFACILPDVSYERALEVAERIRSTFEQAGRQIGEDALSATVSVGVAMSDASEQADLAALLETADRALYRAKSSGRNRIERDGTDLLGSPASPGVHASMSALR